MLDLLKLGLLVTRGAMLDVAKDLVESLATHVLLDAPGCRDAYSDARIDHDAGLDAPVKTFPVSKTASISSRVRPQL